jgi:hypothetical protein
MSRLPAVPAAVVVVVLGLGGLVAGCGSDDDGGGDAAPDKPAVCDSVSALRSAAADLKDMTVRSDGVSGIQDQLDKVQSAYTDLRKDAADEFGSQVDTVDSDLSSLKDDVSSALEKPDLSTLASIGTGVQTLADDVTSLVNDIENTC